MPTPAQLAQIDSYMATLQSLAQQLGGIDVSSYRDDLIRHADYDVPDLEETYRGRLEDLYRRAGPTASAGGSGGDLDLDGDAMLDASGLPASAVYGPAAWVVNPQPFVQAAAASLPASTTTTTTSSAAAGGESPVVPAAIGLALVKLLGLI